MKKRNNYTLIGFIAFIILIILLILHYKNNNNQEIDESIVKCIANKSTLYISRTCSHCEEQKEILTEYLGLFYTVDCISRKWQCDEAGITAIPTWIINEKKYQGVKSLEELKRLAGC